VLLEQLNFVKNKKGASSAFFQLHEGTTKHPCTIEISKGTHLMQVRSPSLFLFALLKIGRFSVREMRL